MISSMMMSNIQGQPSSTKNWLVFLFFIFVIIYLIKLKLKSFNIICKMLNTNAFEKYFNMSILNKLKINFRTYKPPKSYVFRRVWVTLTSNTPWHSLTQKNNIFCLYFTPNCLTLIWVEDNRKLWEKMSKSIYYIFNSDPSAPYL